MCIYRKLVYNQAEFSECGLLPCPYRFSRRNGSGTCLRLRKILRTAWSNGAVIVAYFSGFSCLFTLPFLILDFHPMTIFQILCLLGAGAGAAGGQFAITAAYTHAPAREISVYDYSQLIFTTILGYFLFGDIPDGWSFLGYFIIIAMAVLVFLYNNVWHKDSEVKG